MAPTRVSDANLVRLSFVNLMPASAEYEGHVSEEETKAASFEQLICWITANRDEFDIPKFKADLPAAVRERDDIAVLVASENNTAAEYHALFGWTITDEEVQLNVEYYGGPLDLRSKPAGEKSGSDIEGPPAETLMQWLGQFFAIETVTVHVHARYRYPSHSRETTFDLRLQSDAPHGARLYGVALQLPAKPNGIVSVRLTRGSSDWYAEVISEQDITFRDFSPIHESNTLEAFLKSFLREV